MYEHLHSKRKLIKIKGAPFYSKSGLFEASETRETRFYVTKNITVSSKQSLTNRYQ